MYWSFLFPKIQGLDPNTRRARRAGADAVVAEKQRGKLARMRIANDDSAAHTAWRAAAIECRGEVRKATVASGEAWAGNRAREKELAETPRRGSSTPGRPSMEHVRRRPASAQGNGTLAKQRWILSPGSCTWVKFPGRLRCMGVCMEEQDGRVGMVELGRQGNSVKGLAR
jgi:hypothetical protein